MNDGKVVNDGTVVHWEGVVLGATCRYTTPLKRCRVADPAAPLGGDVAESASRVALQSQGDICII